MARMLPYYAVVALVVVVVIVVVLVLFVSLIDSKVVIVLCHHTRTFCTANHSEMMSPTTTNAKNRVLQRFTASVCVVCDVI